LSLSSFVLHCGSEHHIQVSRAPNSVLDTGVKCAATSQSLPKSHGLCWSLSKGRIKRAHISRAPARRLVAAQFQTVEASCWSAAQKVQIHPAQHPHPAPAPQHPHRPLLPQLLAVSTIQRVLVQRRLPCASASIYSVMHSELERESLACFVGPRLFENLLPFGRHSSPGAGYSSSTTHSPRSLHDLHTPPCTPLSPSPASLSPVSSSPPRNFFPPQYKRFFSQINDRHTQFFFHFNPHKEAVESKHPDR
jgi:hypothetical protein